VRHHARVAGNERLLLADAGGEFRKLWAHRFFSHAMRPFGSTALRARAALVGEARKSEFELTQCRSATQILAHCGARVLGA
jgi:hypothetical protein